VICAATLLGEIGDCRARYPHRDAIAVDAGRRPSPSNLANASTQRFAGHATNGYATRWALAHATCRWHAWAADRYAAARARGHNHPRALRTLGRAWSRIIWRCWQTRTPYDPQLHTGLQQHITVTIPSQSGPRTDLPATQRMGDSAVTPRAARRAERAAA